MIRSMGMVLVTAAVAMAAVTPPDTPAGHVLSQWMESFNSGDKARLTAFAEKFHPKLLPQIDGFVRFREATGGFELVRVTKSEPLLLVGLVKERNSDTVAEFEFKYEAEGESLKLASMRLQAVPAPPDLAPKRLSDADLVGAVDRYVKENSAQRLSGALIAARSGQVVVSRAFGLADRERKVPAALDTRFRIGSMNKMFTAVATLQLVDQGKLELDKPIATYLKDYPNQNLATRVTLRHLLTHTGGTGDIFGPEFDKNRLQLKTLADYVRLYGNRDPEFDPGSRWRYSNYGFLLLGRIIEAASGQSYYDYVREHVFKPAGMDSTDSLSEEDKVERRSIGYTRQGGQWTPNTETLPWRGTSAGGGYSTVEDLQKFARALLSGKLLRKELLAEATRNHMNNYGFGFGVRGGKDEPLTWGHGGGAPGMNGELRIYPESGWVIAVLANLDPPAASKLADYIALRMRL